MSTLIKDYIQDVYTMLGNADRSQLAIEVVLVHLYNEINKRLKQMNISEQNYLLKKVERSITEEQDQLVSVADMGVPVAVHMLNPYTDVDFRIEMVNFNALQDVGVDGRLVCSIYGDPKRIRFSVRLNAYSNWKIVYWYEPDATTARGPNANSPLPDTFRPLVTSNVAMHCLPDLEQDPETKAGRMLSLQSSVSQWEELWDKEINASKQYGNNRRTAFRAGRFDRRNLRW